MATSQDVHTVQSDRELITSAAVFTDMQGNELFALKNKHFTIHKSFHAEAPGGKDIFVVKGHFSCEFKLSGSNLLLLCFCALAKIA